MKLPKTPPDPYQVIHAHHGTITDLLETEGFQLLAREAENRYLSWDRFSYVAQTHGVDPEPAWAIIKLGRQSRYKRVRLKGVGNRPIRFLVSDSIQRELMLIDQELAGQVGAPEEGALNASQKEKFIVNAFREEAIASSMLEGAATTRKAAKAMLTEGRSPRNRGEQMVLNNYEAIMFLREHQNAELTPEFLLELHTIVTRGTLDDPSESGRFRTTRDEIVIKDHQSGKTLYVPPPADQLKKRLQDLCDFANQKDATIDGFIHPVIRACLLHFQIGFDHPFCDGNGRTARALFYWLMLRNHYWLFEYLPISRLIYRGPSKYARAFLHTEVDENDATHFLVYKANIIQRARTELKEYITAKQDEIRKARRLFADDHSLNHRQRDLILQATRNPDRRFTISEYASQHLIQYATARSDLLRLESRGYLVKVKVGKKFEFSAGAKIQEMLH